MIGIKPEIRKCEICNEPVLTYVDYDTGCPDSFVICDSCKEKQKLKGKVKEKVTIELDPYLLYRLNISRLKTHRSGGKDVGPMSLSDFIEWIIQQETWRWS